MKISIIDECTVITDFSKGYNINETTIKEVSKYLGFPLEYKKNEYSEIKESETDNGYIVESKIKLKREFVEKAFNKVFKK